ncbi:MAG: dihydroxyacetone kinase [Chloroflexi bacterium RBG_19FT_COMBO_48_23]|nr:MAG: dihydroxyacetone kinase [Chloroflexi bacterium RBG_19FT_COMBO_48_23]
MKQVRSCDGQEFRDMFAAGSSWLEKSVPDINAINVFPVPDGDTGTNMFLTMRSVMEEADRVSGSSVSDVAKAMAQGALMGARGNSGVILSQFFRGLAKGLDEKESATGSDLAVALDEACRAAYKGLSQPVEGTMLTVIKDAAKAAKEAARTAPDNLTGVAEAAVDAAKDSVARTPLLLDVLREAGVVDAGGQGIYVLLEGALRYLEGKVEEMRYRRPQVVTAELPVGPRATTLVAESEEPYGYCTNFLLEGHKLNPDKIRKKMESKGQSVVVVGDETTVRIHIHTYDPGDIIRYATSLGTLHQLQVQNMDDQHVGFVEMQKEKLPSSDIGVVAVAAGNGMREVFRSLGAAAIVTGGQTMNPSVQEILQAVEALPSQKIILLPNNKNIILAASQVQSLTSKEISVIPARTMPQGIAALIAFNYEGGMKENVQVMEDAVATVKTVEITESARSTQLQGLKIKKGQAIAILDDDKLLAVNDNMEEVLFEALDKAGIDSAEVVTVYYGADIEEAQAEQVAQKIRDKNHEKQVETVSGGQPHYRYIVSLE